MTVADNQGLRTFLDKLDCVEAVGPNSWRALCPLHSDVHPSLTIDVVLRDGHPKPMMWCTKCHSVFAEVIASQSVV